MIPANANGATHAATVVREPIDLLEAWIGAEVRRGKVERLELVQRTERYPEGRLLETWTADTATGARDLAAEAMARAAYEATHGFDGAGVGPVAYELVSQPSGKHFSLDVPVRERAGLARAAASDHVVSVIVDQLRRDQENKEKFLAASQATAAKIHELYVQATTTREAQAATLITALSKAFQGQIDSLTSINSKLMDERVTMLSQWMQWSASNTAAEREAKREDEKARMKHEVFTGLLKPMLPTIAGKILAGAAVAMGGASPPPAPSTPTDATPRNVTERQATALVALFKALEPPDYEAIAGVLTPEKRLLFVAVAEAYLATE